MDIETVKKKLQAALERLEDTIAAKLSYLEEENACLRAEVVELKQKLRKTQSQETPIPSLASKKKKPSQSAMLSVDASEQIDISLSKLKEMAG